MSYFSWQKKPFFDSLGKLSFEAGGETYYTAASSQSLSDETTAKFAGINDSVPKFGDKDAARLAEALASVDYGGYELISSGKNYEIKRIKLKHNYYIDFIFRNKNDSVTSSYNYNKSVTPESDFHSMDIYLRYPGGETLAKMQLNASFLPVFLYDKTVSSGNFGYNGKLITYDKSTAAIKYHSVLTESNAAQITLSGKSRGIKDAADDSSIVEAVVTLDIKDGAKTKSFTFNLQIECYFNGLTTAWIE
jgi:hypothetical protein